MTCTDIVIAGYTQNVRTDKQAIRYNQKAYLASKVKIELSHKSKVSLPVELLTH